MAIQVFLCHIVAKFGHLARTQLLVGQAKERVAIRTAPKSGRGTTKRRARSPRQADISALTELVHSLEERVAQLAENTAVRLSLDQPSAQDKGAVSPIATLDAVYLAGKQDVPRVRAGPAALGDLLRHGYSEKEISALVVPKRTLARRRAANALLTVEETDKALRLQRVAAMAERVFGDPAKAYRWLRKPKRALRGQTPLAFLASETGARVVEGMLHRIEHGMYA